MISRFREFVICAALLALCIPALASPKKHDFKGTMDQVFDAALVSAQKNWTVEFADRKAHMLTFHSGVSLTSNGMECSASFRDVKPGTVEVILHTQKKMQVYAWGVGGRIADKFFKAIDQQLETDKPEAANDTGNR